MGNLASETGITGEVPARSTRVPPMETGVLSHSRKQLYNQHLELVSRSFAVCIARLEEPAQTYIGMTYLICRALDCVEDAVWESQSEQIEFLRSLAQFFENPTGPLPNISSFLGSVKGLTTAETELMQDVPLLGADLKGVPEEIQKAIGRLVRSMSLGMEHYILRKSEGELRISDLSDLNRYCYFVAGVVGEGLTCIISSLDSQMEVSESTIEQAHHFGFFLQKVNILKDQRKDEAEGRYFVPSRELVLASLKTNAKEAWEYIRSIPDSQISYRVFCLWSFLLGLRTLPLLVKNDVNEMKISRSETLHLLIDIDNLANADTSALQNLFSNLFAAVKWPDNNQVHFDENSNEADWFIRERVPVCNKASLSAAAMKRLSLL